MAGPRKLPDPDRPGGPDGMVAVAADLITEWKLSRPVMQRQIRLSYWRIAVEAVIAVVLIVAVAVAFVLIHHNTVTVAQLHASNVDACRAGNARFAKQQRALDAILSGRQGLTPAQRQRLAADRAHIAAGWAPRDCSKLYSLKGK